MVGIVDRRRAAVVAHHRAAGLVPRSLGWARHSPARGLHSLVAGVAVRPHRVVAVHHSLGQPRTEMVEKLVGRKDSSSTGDFFGLFEA